MKRTLRVAWIITLVVMALQVAAACPACYGDKDSPMTAGMNAAILVMLGIIGAVLSLIITFFIMMWRRFKRQQGQFSQEFFIDDRGNLQTKNQKGVVEWNNF